MRELLEKLLSDAALSEAETETIFGSMLRGELAEAQIAAVLAAWRLRGESAKELAIGARAMRKAATAVILPDSVRPLIDNCGTGGDGSHSFNLSTAAAIVAAAAGARVAKHGGRSVSSLCGSADLLFAAGYPDNLSPAATGTLLAQTGFTFFFAPNFHPAMRHVGPVRKSLGIRTIFNLLGPLANPIAPDFQLIGVGAKRYLRPMAEALQALGTKRAMVVHSRDGLDEISPAAATDAICLRDGRLETLVIEPSALGVRGTLKDIEGGDPQRNLQILNDLLQNKAPRLADAVSLNAGAVLWLADVAPSLAEGIQRARARLSDGAAAGFFNNWLAKAAALGGS